jgi:hypothetical protein
LYSFADLKDWWLHTHTRSTLHGAHPPMENFFPLHPAIFNERETTSCQPFIENQRARKTDDIVIE